MKHYLVLLVLVSVLSMTVHGVTVAATPAADSRPPPVAVKPAPPASAAHRLSPEERAELRRQLSQYARLTRKDS
jgi:hypothetical protein